MALLEQYYCTNLPIYKARYNIFFFIFNIVDDVEEVLSIINKFGYRQKKN